MASAPSGEGGPGNTIRAGGSRPTVRNPFQRADFRLSPRNARCGAVRRRKEVKTTSEDVRRYNPVKHSEPAKPGSRLAGYNVLAQIGRGAASVIYLVQDPKSKQIWALKHVEKNGPKDVRFIEQAEQEAAVSSRLDHPVIRRITKVSKNRSLTGVKELFMLMEYVDGVSIDKHPPETFEKSVDIFRQVARGLAHMHARGFVHADMKPNNVVICDDGSVKVIDLGQSCAIGAVKERIQGTPDYIAPEQVHLRAITPKTDIYNLGATMYWVLTKRHIPTAIPKGDSLIGSLDDHMIEKPKPIQELNARVPDMLAELIMQSVAIDPDLRPPDMDWVADRLDLIYGKIVAERKLREGQKNPDSGDSIRAASPDGPGALEQGA